MLLQTAGEEIKQVHFLTEQCLCVQLSSPIRPSVHRRVGCFHFLATPWLMLHEQVVQVCPFVHRCTAESTDTQRNI